MFDITRSVDYICYLKTKLYQIISNVKQTNFTTVNMVEVARTGSINIYAY